MSREITQRERVAVVGLSVILVLVVGFMLITKPWATTLKTAEEPVTTPAQTTPAKTTASETVKKPAFQNGEKKPVVSAESRLRAALASRPAVVVSLYSEGAYIDSQTLVEAKAGAQQSGMGFLSFNMLDEDQARLVADMLDHIGTVRVAALPTSPTNITSTPVVLIFTRPMTIALQFGGLVDRDVIAQAAQIAGGSPAGELWQRQANAVCSTGAQEAQTLLSSLDGETDMSTGVRRMIALIDKTTVGLKRIHPPASQARDYAKLVAAAGELSGKWRHFLTITTSDKAAVLAALDDIDRLGVRFRGLSTDLGLAACY